MNKFLVGVIVILVVVIGGYFLFKGAATGNVVADGSEDVVVINLTSSHFRFYLNGVESPELKVKEGDKVKIILNNEEGFHDWKIDEFNAATQQVSAGKVTSVEFIADKKGTFEYYCSVGQHRANGMLGKLIVE